ncbi:LamG-like jellyroll fold domain-containing protein [Micromonospora sp. NPDC050200]|uniref:LamG-like jellyroll fold domain-containing protein n=1 Tax=Micromonospora sp. NPDC050200 TaxID=3155664 RepID=UPI00340A1AD0
MVGLAGLLSSTAYVEQWASEPVPVPVAAMEENPVRDTEPEALLAAASLNQPVEVLAERSEFRDVFAQPDGTLIANEYNQAVRVLQGDSWVPTDATLVAQPDGTFTPTATLLNMRLSGGGSTPLMVAERDARVMTLTWPNPLPTPTLNGAQLIYPEVFTDVDLVANVTVEGFSHVLVLKTPEAANLPELQTLKLGVTGEGLDIQETADGGVVALDPATANPVMEADAPTMWDSGTQEGTPPDGGGLRSSATTDAETTVGDDPNAASAQGPGDNSRVAQVGLDYTQGTLRLTPDPAMLADPDTTYPVYVDPVWQSSTNSAWAMVDSGYPNEEYWKFDTKRHERIALCPNYCNSSKVKRLFYRLATPYAGKTILSATFRVTLQHVYNSTARAAALYLMPAGISTSTNWSNQPGGSSWSTATHLDTNSPTSVQSTCTSTNQNTEWDAKVAVQQAVAKGWSNVTLGMKSVNESDSTHTKRFCDNGVLSVRYNRAPLIANLSELTMSPGGACVYATNVPYTPEVPRLDAIMRDPDHSSSHTEQIQTQFKVTYTPPGGTLQTLTYTTPYKASGSKFSYYVPKTIPQNVTMSWEVRAFDGVSWGPWSSDGSRNVCQFIFDATSPSAPDVDSAEYLPLDSTDTTADCLDDDQWRGSIGVVGSFTFDSAATDVVEYQYNFNGGPTISVKPTISGGPVTIQWTPDKEGPRQLFVKAVDAAKRASSPAACTFRVGKRPPVSQWPMADVAGAAYANDVAGPNDAKVGSGVTFASDNNFGQWDRSAVFDGTSNAYMVTDKSVLADTSQSFAITGWFRVDDVNRRQVAVSQDGTGEPGFSLGVDQGTWFFRMPTNDVLNLGEWKVTAGAATTEWTFVTAIFDGPNKKISLQVGAAAPVVKDRRSLVRARGPLQLGRHTYKGGGYSDFWKGGMADVSVFDRPIVTEDSTGLQKQVLVRKGYWQVNDQVSKQSPEVDGGSPLLLSQESILAKTPTPIGRFVGTGHLRLMGKADQYAETSSAVVDPTGSFTITARVRLTSSSVGHPMTAFSVKGTNNTTIVVRANGDGQWELAATTEDKTGAQFTPVETGAIASRSNSGNHLALVYNGYTRELVLWVDGQSTALPPLANPFTPTSMTSLQFGRAIIDGVATEHLSGSLDEIRVYDGVADKVKIDKIRVIGENRNI